MSPSENLYWFRFDWMCCLALDQSHPVFESVLGMGLLFDRHMLSTNMLQQAEWLLDHFQTYS